MNHFYCVCANNGGLMLDLLIKNIKHLATPVGNFPKSGKEHGKILEIENAAIAIENGIISYVGSMENAPACKNFIDASENLVTPGLVDSHTHLVFGGWRQHEMELKLNNVPYLDILKAGGGILSTVSKTREAAFMELYIKALIIAKDMLSHGTTSFEIKSGYGLDLDTEVKQLNVIKRLQKSFNEDIVATFMGAHAVPNEYKGKNEEYIDFVIEKVLPHVKENNLAEFCDIFCETGVFDVDLSEKLLKAARKLGFKLKIHADEINPIGGGELAGKLGTHSAEHLIAATDEGIKLMADSGTVAILLPATSFYLDKPYARARKMLDENMSVAIASDFNPGSSPSFNLQFCMNLACLKYKLTPQEALTAVTLNAAAAILKEKEIGSLEVGKKADIVIWDCPDLNFLFYRYGNNQAKHVIKKGVLQ